MGANHPARNPAKYLASYPRNVPAMAGRMTRKTTLLQQHGVKTSRARVAEYGRTVLDGGKKRKRRKRAKTAPAANIPATPQSAPAMAAKPAPPKPAPATAITSDVPSPQTESSPYRSRGPHIANVRMMKAEEAKEFNDSLKPKPPAS